jgi:hypothetical protein
VAGEKVIPPVQHISLLFHSKGWSLSDRPLNFSIDPFRQFTRAETAAIRYNPQTIQYPLQQFNKTLALKEIQYDSRND